MKKLILYIFILPLLVAYGCSANEDYLKYDTTLQDEVYINATASTDSIYYNFGFANITEDTVKVTVNLVGMPKDYDREFYVKMDNSRYAYDTHVAATDDYVDVPTVWTMPAGEVTTEVPIILKRHVDLETVKAIVTIEISSSDDLNVNGYKEYTVTFDDFLATMPTWWTYGTNTTDLGEYTKAKYIKIIEYFRAYEAVNPTLYAYFVEYYGENLNSTDRAYYECLKIGYPITFRENIWMPLYDYQESAANADRAVSGVSNPY